MPEKGPGLLDRARDGPPIDGRFQRPCGQTCGRSIGKLCSNHLIMHKKSKWMGDLHLPVIGFWRSLDLYAKAFEAAEVARGSGLRFKCSGVCNRGFGGPIVRGVSSRMSVWRSGGGRSANFVGWEIEVGQRAIGLLVFIVPSGLPGWAVRPGPEAPPAERLSGSHGWRLRCPRTWRSFGTVGFGGWDLPLTGLV